MFRILYQLPRDILLKRFCKQPGFTGLPCQLNHLVVLQLSSLKFFIQKALHQPVYIRSQKLFYLIQIQRKLHLPVNMFKASVLTDCELPPVEENRPPLCLLISAHIQLIPELRLEKSFLNRLRHVKEIVIIIFHKEVMFPAAFLIILKTRGYRLLCLLIQPV